jgi:hypothetical protein
VGGTDGEMIVRDIAGPPYDVMESSMV